MGTQNLDVTYLLPWMSPVCCPGCHPERSEGSSVMGTQNLDVTYLLPHMSS